MKTIVITGATGAIGMAAAKALSQKGNVHLVLVGRNIEKMDRLKNTLGTQTTIVDLIRADLGDAESVKRGIESIRSRYGKVDGLINIAAVYKAQRTLTNQNRETMFATNHLAPFALTTGLLDILKNTPGSKVLTVTAPSSTKIDFENLNSEKKFSSLGVFGGTKMMNLLFAFRLSKLLPGNSHASIAFHPGLVKSELLNESPAMLRGLFRLISSSPDKTGNAIASLILEGKTDTQNGKFYNNAGKELKAASFAYDEGVQQKLWRISETMLSSR
jgi:short-subunit dehydrogenase